ncbi:hypothetical protein GE09DRAFT_770593 [Coniochaeta sp. 2T2.1]|nr:hypothetical protein GE09DRAFT_770593 [Coniochaeta sp. 2T2.1]
MASDKSHVSGRESDSNPLHASKLATRDIGAGLSAGSLATIVVFGTIVLVGGVAFVGLFVARRRRREREKNSSSSQKEQTYEHSYHDVEDSLTTRRNKLQKKKKKEWPLAFEASTPDEIASPVRHTVLPQIPPLFAAKSSSSFTSFFGKLSPTKSVKTTKSWKQTSWIDEDNLHGPKMSDVRDVNGQPFSRDSWPLYTLTAPTMPTVTTEHVHPYYRGLYQQHQMAQAQMAQQAQMVAAQPYITSAGPRQLPLPPPRPALVTSNWVTSTMGHAGGYYSIQDLVKNGRSLTTISPEPPQQPPPQQTAQRPGRSRSRSRSHHRRPSRQSSTDSVLSEILKSTEQRLAERSPSKSRPGRAHSSSGNTSSRETLLARGERSTDDTGSCHLCRSCSASPTKRSPDQQPPPPNNNPSSAMGHSRGGSDSSAFGHRRNNSDSSAISEPDSLMENDFQVIPAGLTSPSRSARSNDTPDQSPAASVSSGLPTLYSESEADEEDDEANERSPLRPTIYQRSLMRQSMPASSIPDPFTSPSSSPTRPTTSRGIPNQSSLRKTTFGAGLLSSPKDATSPTMRYNNQLQGIASSPNQSQTSQEQGAAYINLLPLDLYQLCTPPRQAAPLKSPTIISPHPDSVPHSVHPKKRTLFGSTSTINSTPTSSPPPPVPALPRAAPPPSSQQEQHEQQPPAQPQQRPKAYPPPHNLKPKGSSPTLGRYSPLTSPSAHPFPFAPPPHTSSSSTTSTPSSSLSATGTAAGPKGPRPRPGDEPCAPPPSMPPPPPAATNSINAIAKRHMVLQTPSKISHRHSSSTIKLRVPSNTSNSSSVYSQDSVPPLPASQQPVPVVSTVAALRRMNSAVSHASGTSAASDGSGNGTPPVPSLARFAGVGVGVATNAGSGIGAGGVARRGRHRRGNNGSRNYLGLLEVGKRGSKMDVVVWDEKTGGGDRDKENTKQGGETEEEERDGEEEKEMEMGQKRKKEWRDSKDSLGLYDEDGFLISSPVRGGE